MYRLLSILFTLAVFSCGKKTNDNDLKQIYTDSIRRDATAEESMHVVKTHRGCTAFWIENDSGHNLLMTVRHCFDFAINEACKEKVKFYSASGDEVAECKSVVAAEHDKDVALIEVNMLEEIKTKTLKIDARIPTKILDLKMIGFPADSARKGKLTVSENCQTRGNTLQTVRPNEPQSLDQGIFHDCSTFGGNSGGPILIEKTDFAVGIPGTYLKAYDESNKIPTSTVDPYLVAKMHLLHEFANDHRETLKNWKVKVIY